MSIKVAIVEDDKNYNNALKKIIDYDEEMQCVAQFYDGREALKHLMDQNPDVVIMDIKLPNILGIEVLSRLKSEMENTQFMMCTSFEDEETIFKSLKAGATGYLLKGDKMEKIISSIKDVFNGGAPMSFTVAKKVLNHFHDKKAEITLQELTFSEKEILELLAEGFLYKEIASKKNISIDTVKKHIGNIYRKLQVSNKVEAVNKLNNSKL